MRVLLGSGAVVAAIVFLSHPNEPARPSSSEPPVLHPAPVSAPPPSWQPIAQPKARYSIDSPVLQGLAFAYEARRNQADEREDILAFGASGQDAQPLLRLVVQQQARPERQDTSFFVDLARRAAQAGLAVTRSAPASGLPTKFGTAEAADVVLAGEAERACLAFRFSRPETALRIGGWLCGAGGQPPSQRDLGCVIDGLSLRSSDDPTLTGLFAEAERRRDATCAPPPRVAEAAKPAPALRNARRR